MKLNPKQYDAMVQKANPKSPVWKDCAWAFFVGGAICLLGEGIRQTYLGFWEKELAGTMTSVTLILLSALMTIPGWYQKLAAKAGAGTLVPITGFANSVVSPAIEFKAEGWVTGVGAKIFTIAGPVLAFGTLASWVFGLLYWASQVYKRLLCRTLAAKEAFYGMATRRGDTLIFERPPVIAAWAAAGGKRESEGPQADGFDFLTQDTGFEEEDCENWEQAESMLQQKAVEACLRKAGVSRKEIDLAFAGDLQAQCTASNYTMRAVGAPFAGVYGACSTMAETLCLAACFAQGRMVRQALAFTSSHFCAAERQYRTPLAYGGKRPPTAQWTATAAGACLVRAPGGEGIPILSATFGRVQDYEVHDITNMGAAMMPAAASTLLRYFEATGTRPEDFDAVLTGDLATVGSDLLREQMEKEGFPLPNHWDCGCLLYDVENQNVQAGGSGAGCSAAVLCTQVLPMLQSGRWRRVLFLSTGALMSQTTFLQGESIPGIAHCVELGGKEGAV